MLQHLSRDLPRPPHPPACEAAVASETTLRPKLLVEAVTRKLPRESGHSVLAAVAMKASLIELGRLPPMLGEILRVEMPSQCPLVLPSHLMGSSPGTSERW